MSRSERLDFLSLKARRPKLTCIACIESTQQIGDRIERDTCCIISSLPADTTRILHAVHTHRGIENGLHWYLDVTFGDDASLIRLRNAAHNLEFLRRTALKLFRADSSRKFSLAKKRKTTARNPDDLALVLGMTKV